MSSPFHFFFSSFSIVRSHSLQLGLGLRLLENGLHLHRLHHVASDLQLAAHEESLGIRLAGNQGAKVFVREDEGDCTTITLIR